MLKHIPHVNPPLSALVTYFLKSSGVEIAPENASIKSYSCHLTLSCHFEILLTKVLNYLETDSYSLTKKTSITYLSEIYLCSVIFTTTFMIRKCLVRGEIEAAEETAIVESVWEMF